MTSPEQFSKKIQEYNVRDPFDYLHIDSMHMPDIDIPTALNPLLQQLEKYDCSRVKLEQEGGNIADINNITDILSEPVTINGLYEKKELILSKQQTVRSALQSIDYNLILDVRLQPTHMPVYYLCRIYNDFHGEHGFILEDYYRSPGHPFQNSRFVKLMPMGHEIYHLRLSNFRSSLKTFGKNKKKLLQDETDSLLYDIGSYIFQAAWHEDQHLGIAISQVFNLPNFAEAIELLYLTLSAELCELRGAINTPMLTFIEEIYKSPYILHFLNRLLNANGKKLNELPQKALPLYKKLLGAFSTFLRMEVPWGIKKSKIVLWKLFYGNFYNMDVIGKEICQFTEIMEAAINLDQEGHQVCIELIKNF